MKRMKERLNILAALMPLALLVSLAMLPGQAQAVKSYGETELIGFSKNGRYFASIINGVDFPRKDDSWKAISGKPYPGSFVFARLRILDVPKNDFARFKRVSAKGRPGKGGGGRKRVLDQINKRGAAALRKYGIVRDNLGEAVQAGASYPARRGKFTVQPFTLSGNRPYRLELESRKARVKGRARSKAPRPASSPCAWLATPRAARGNQKICNGTRNSINPAVAWWITTSVSGCSVSAKCWSPAKTSWCS